VNAIFSSAKLLAIRLDLNEEAALIGFLVRRSRRARLLKETIKSPDQFSAAKRILRTLVADNRVSK
jgi:hypothetical protein